MILSLRMLKRERIMRGWITGILTASLFFFVFTSVAFGGDKIIKMSTTTSTQASGLLDVLLPELKKDTGIRVKVFAKGTGAAIRDGMDGNVDVIFVHARAREEKFVAEGYGAKRYAVMHNDFVILGPAKDPAGIKGIRAAGRALNGSPRPKPFLYPAETTAEPIPKSRPSGNNRVFPYKTGQPLS